MEPENCKYCKFYLRLFLLIADLYIYFRKGADVEMVLRTLKKALIKHKARILKHIAGGVNMNEVAMLRGAEPRKILQTVIEEKTPAVMSYLSKGKWYVAKVLLTGLGAGRLNIQILPGEKPHPINIQVDQPVGISLKYGYGKFIFETKVIGLEPSPEATAGGTILLAVPDRIEIVQRRSYFRVEVPKSLKVNVMFWHRHHKEGDTKSEKEHLGTPDEHQVSSDRYCQGKLVDISAGGAQIVVDAGQTQNFKKGQFIGLRFTPMPYETPLMFDAQIRNTLPTADNKSICFGLQIVGLEASPEGRQVLQRLCNIVERYYQINQSSVKQQDMQGDPILQKDRKMGMQEPHLQYFANGTHSQT